MFAKLSIPQRLHAGLILVMAFLLVLGSNRLDKKHFETVQNTVNSVYKDRVMVQDFIYQLNNIFHTKELELTRTGQFTMDDHQNGKIRQLLDDFAMTELTAKESNLLYDLDNTYQTLIKVKETDNGMAIEKTALVSKQFDEIQTKLDGLAQIQLNESGQLTQLSNKSLGMNSLMSNLEIAFLIVIGILMLALIFYPGKSPIY
ncbi:MULTISPECIES: hypothetical protein [Maribacter]|uniref:Chemotaxis methyl-accepting receptor HlyB-like 4HB MCP domain-containing protein n=1 Tax=Maribacter flavus TaxID=1658664 RepID=A0A5B2TS65_9FLAO|nr:MULTISPECIES: hypothetical protein [Maribacter]KAA2217436.1 hypothetical protein F0361_15955 [Maribacter flavus]MDC6405717.1 hypothetical protein [Maribacter sp. PR66]MEE1973031.1 hypothetical protein [Maribacter flavus]